MINPTDKFISLVSGDAIREVSRKVAPFSFNNAHATVTTFDANSAKFDVDIEFYNSADEKLRVCTLKTEEPWGVASIWTVVVSEDCDKVQVHQDSNAATISILTFIPQYFLITVGEIMVSVTGVEWAYTEAPPSKGLSYCLCEFFSTFFWTL